MHTLQSTNISCDWFMSENISNLFTSRVENHESGKHGSNFSVLWELKNLVWPLKCTLLSSFLYKVVLTFAFLNEILKCDHSNESYWAVLSCGTVHYAVQGDSNFWVCGLNPKVWPFKWKLLCSTFPKYCSFSNILHNDFWEFTLL